jgi:carboxymethylenebutenolidase
VLALPVPDGTLPVTVAEPDGAPRTAVIVVQEAFGVTSHIADVARRAAAAGHLALAPHVYHRTGDPEISYDDLPSIWPHIKALTAEGLAADVDACLVHLDGLGIPPGAVAVIGFCMGGTVALAEGARLRLGAAVTFYGGGVAEGRFGYPALTDLAPRLQTPWLGLYGDRDAGIPVEQVEALRAAAATAPVPTEVVRYDADHGFHCDDRPAVFDADAAADAWARALAHLSAHLRPSG